MRYQPAAILPSSRWRRVRREVLDRDHRVCLLCGGPATQVDRVRPVVQGGDWYDKGNLAAICGHCRPT